MSVWKRSQVCRFKQNKPMAIILSSTLMLRHIKEEETATRIEEALSEVLSEGKHVTYDLGGSATTSEMAEAICQKLRN